MRRHFIRHSLAMEWIRRIQAQRIETHFGVTVLGRDSNGLVAYSEQEGHVCLQCDKIILATGARELFLPFPGWTLPNVFGAGGAQALLKAGMPVEGKRIVVAGSGPLLLAVAATFAKKGAHVVGILEQAGIHSLLQFAPELIRHPAKLIQGVGFGTRLFPTRPRFGTWVCRAMGNDIVREVIATDGKREWPLPCDILACGFGLVPNVELAQALGCDVEKGKVSVDEHQATSQSGVYCVGESTGIGGEDVALLEGEIAALAALDIPNVTSKIHERWRWESFVSNLGRAFALRKEVLQLAEDTTTVCRCEDVSFGVLKNQPDQRSAKLYTRCGMGPCQGRVCGPACHELFGWELNKPRWPLSPVTLDALLDSQ